jgi:hypothetical protein
VVVSTPYQPKHKKKASAYGSIPRGPERWMRAAHNAFTRPNTSNAHLFMDRVSNAHRLRKEYAGQENEPIVFFKYTTTWDPELRQAVVDEVQHERRYVTCGLFCAAMQVQLDFPVSTYEDLEFFLEFDFRTNLLRNAEDKLVRAVRCQACGTTIKPGA